MMTLVEELEEIIPRVLPIISETVQQLVIDRLLSSGLDSTADLKYVKQEDIADLLPVIQQQKPLDAFKMGMFSYITIPLYINASCMDYLIFFSNLETETITLDLQVLPSPTTAVSSNSGPLSSPSSTSLPSCSESSRTEDSQPSSHIRRSWPESFQVPWNAMPVDIHSDMAGGKRPLPAECACR